MSIPNQSFHPRARLIACAIALLMPATPAHCAAPAPYEPFQYVRTIQVTGESSFGRALSDYDGKLLIGASNKAYLYDAQTNAILQSYDHSGGTSNSSNWLTGYGDKIAVGTATGTGFVQVFNATSGQLLQSYNGSEAGDRFGWSLASNGADLFVGAPELRNGLTYYGNGKVVVLNSVGNRRTIMNPEPGSSLDEESFGYDIGIIGNDLYVGALYDNDGGKVWHIAADSGATLTKFNNPHGSLGNGGRPQFGASLDVADDYLLVGANQSSASGTNASGAAYLFDRSSGNLLRTFFDPVPGVLDNFGIDVTLVRNFAVIAAHNDRDGKSNGAVFVFDINTGQHVQTIETPLSSSTFFGSRVQQFGQNWLAVRESTDGGKVHIYSLVPEPPTCSILMAMVVVLMSAQRGFPCRT